MTEIFIRLLELKFCRPSNVTVSNMNHSGRTKRSETYVDADEGTMRELLRLSRFIEMIASEHNSHSNGHRRKRDTSHYLNDVVHEIQTELENLETSMDLNTSVNSSTENANSTEKFGIKCFIETNGKVNCSNVIYENERSWKKSRDQVDLLIQVLKTKIVELKDIRRHLKEHKPKNVTDDEETVSENALTSTEDSDERTEEMMNVQKQSRRPHYNSNTSLEIATSILNTSEPLTTEQIGTVRGGLEQSSKRTQRINSTTLASASVSVSTTTSKPRSTTTVRGKITSTAKSKNRTHPVPARRNHQNTRNSTSPTKTRNLENNHRHLHQHRTKISNTSHPTKRIHDDSNRESINVDAKLDKHEKIDDKFHQEIDPSRAECFCEPER